MSGEIFADPRPVGLDIKSARRKAGSENRLSSAIAVATYDKYFRDPNKKYPMVMAPYGSFWCHIDLIAVYDLDVATVRNVDVFAQEVWRIATTKKASGTRCYVASVMDIDRLKSGKGDFRTIDDFYKFWREYPLSSATESTVAEKRRRMKRERLDE